MGSWFEFIVLTFYLPKIGFGHSRSIIKIIFKNKGKCIYFYKVISIHGIKTLLMITPFKSLVAIPLNRNSAFLYNIQFW